MVASTRVVDADAASQLVLGYAFRASDDPERGAWRFGIAAEDPDAVMAVLSADHHIPDDKAADLLAIKRNLGLPDARLDVKECQLCDLPEPPGTIARPPSPPRAGAAGAATADGDDVESIVQAVTDAVMAALAGSQRA